jgi:protein ImuA
MTSILLSAAAAEVASPSLPAGIAASVWRAGQMASFSASVTPSGWPALDKELPNQGWPHRGVIELLIRQAGIGEMRLLQPALQRVTGRIALLQPPHMPHVATWIDWGLAPERLLWIRTQRHADLLWSAEQILRNGSCGALLIWQGVLRNEALRRLQLAAQTTDIICWLIRPLLLGDTSSPASLRLALQPRTKGLQINVLKRRGPPSTVPLLLPWSLVRGNEPFFTDESDYALLDRRLPTAPASASTAPALV